MNKNIKEKINLLRNSINEHNYAYYVLDNPILSDQEYDDLKLDILKIEKDYPNLITKESPSLKVGFKPSKNFKKIKHKVSMLSLNNAFDEEDLKNFEKK